MSDNQRTVLEVDADDALFEGQVQGVVATLYENERPPCGLSGILDWHFQGAISHYLRQGIVTGKEGEFTYFPMSRNGNTYHLILVGAGQSSSPGKRIPLPTGVLTQLQKNLLSLGVNKICVSKSDLGQVPPEYFSKNFKGIPLWISP